MNVETPSPAAPASAVLSIRLLGPLTLCRDGVPVDVPSSRKLMALLAYLARSPQPLSRSRLCALLWDLPSDPRGELRWYLSKLRALVDDPARPRLLTPGDAIVLQLDDCAVDASDAEAAFAAGLDTLDMAALHGLARALAGDFLEGLEIGHSPQFHNWLTAQRRHFRALRVAVLERLAACVPPLSEERADCLTQWLDAAPYDPRAHIALLDLLHARGQIHEGDAHLAAAAPLFADEGLAFHAVRAHWYALRHPRERRPDSSPPVRIEAVAAPPPPPLPAGVTGLCRASLAVMPFAGGEPGTSTGVFADGLTHDIITRLAKLRHLSIIARGSVFALAHEALTPVEAGRRLGVAYVATGRLQFAAHDVSASVDVVEVATAHIVWSDTFAQRADDPFSALDAIGDSIVAAISHEIETAEQGRAVLKAPNSLNAWEAYHRGLWHMYRFTRDDNRQAQGFFTQARSLDPTFARAHAGLSFTHWQNAFQDWDDRAGQTDLALRTAADSLLADDHDPAAHWAMGRALWLIRNQDEALRELGAAVELSPNFALGHYTLSFVLAQSGDPRQAIEASNQSRRLSPFDPLLFGMLAARGIAHMRLHEFDEAAEWAVRAAARPNAHVIILATAALSLALAGRTEDARTYVASIRRTRPEYGIDDLLDSFHFAPDAVALFNDVAARIGLR